VQKAELVVKAKRCSDFLNGFDFFAHARPSLLFTHPFAKQTPRVRLKPSAAGRRGFQDKEENNGIYKLRAKYKCGWAHGWCEKENEKSLY
jgi:hypothetical protein